MKGPAGKCHRVRLPTGRVEVRLPLAAQVWVTSLDKPGVLEIATTQNVSRKGARISARREWLASERVLVSWPPAFYARARIVYCHQLPDEQYVAGVLLETPAESWFTRLEPTACP
jgi:hypothetical protein